MYEYTKIWKCANIHVEKYKLGNGKRGFKECKFMYEKR